MSDLKSACAYWQRERDNSSVLRGGARRLTNIDHYFKAPFITEYEDRAAADPQLLAYAAVLLDAVRESTPMTASAWRAWWPLEAGDFAGRGLTSKPEFNADDQIEAALETGTITMPLWGISLDEVKARSYGTHLLFVVEGPFQGVAAAKHSEIKEDELEIITGGEYSVEKRWRDEEGTTYVSLRQTGQIESSRPS